MDILIFFNGIYKMPKKKKHKFIKQFVEDRKLVSEMIELSQIATEEEMLEKWIRR